MSTFLCGDETFFSELAGFADISEQMRIKRRGEVPSSSQLVPPRRVPYLSPKVRQHLKPITNAEAVKWMRQKSNSSARIGVTKPLLTEP